MCDWALEPYVMPPCLSSKAKEEFAEETDLRVSVLAILCIGKKKMLPVLSVYFMRQAAILTFLCKRGISLIFFFLSQFFSDYVYFENSSSNPYLIRRIEELNKVGHLYFFFWTQKFPLKVFWYSDNVLLDQVYGLSDGVP